MSAQLNKLFETYAYNPQQKNQLRIADERKLNLDMIKNPAYDWEQMREIALCMEYGVDPTPICDPDIPSENMEEIRTHLFNNQGVFEAAKEKVASQRTKRLQISFISVVLATAVICMAFWKKEVILSFFDSLELVLTDKRIDIGLSGIKDMKYIDYVKSYNDDMQLVLPDQTIDGIGEYTLHYELKNESKSVKKDLVIVVYDDIKPVIHLTQSSVSREYGSSFNARNYIKKATDNADGDITEDIEIKNNVSTSTPGTYKVIYSVQDAAGNAATETLNVTVKEKVVAPVTPNSDAPKKKEPTKPSQGGSSSSGTSKPSVSTYIPASKSFTVETYNDFDECLNACQKYISQCIDKGFTGEARSEPIRQAGVFIGYKAVFKK